MELGGYMTDGLGARLTGSRMPTKLEIEVRNALDSSDTKA